MFGPSPSCDSPTGFAVLQGKREDGADFADWLPLLLEVVVRGDDHVGAVCGDIRVRWVAERDNSIRDAILLGIRFKVADPLGAGPGTVPFVGREFIEDGCLIGTRRQERLRVSLVEAVRKLMNGREHGRLRRSRSPRVCERG